MPSKPISVYLPDDAQSFIDEMVASGRFESVEAVVQTALQSMQEEDARIEKWLREEVMPTYDAMKADPTRGIPAKQAFDELRERLSNRQPKRA